MPRRVMVINLERCTGCQTCVVACKTFNGLGPGIQRVTVLEKEVGEYPDVKRVYIPKRCMNCEDPQCVKVCPTGATSKGTDGVVLIDQDKCMGCRYCMTACPYNARTFYKDHASYYSSPSVWEEKRYAEHTPGVVDKCDFCQARVEDGRKLGLTPGEDAEATPCCVVSCIASALTFGDIDNPESAVRKLIAERRGVQLLPEMGTDPSVYYLPRRTGNEADHR